MVDDIDERKMSLEQLLQDVEFECPSVTLRENTTQHSVDVVENTTDTPDVTSDTAADLPLPLPIVSLVKLQMKTNINCNLLHQLMPMSVSRLELMQL